MRQTIGCGIVLLAAALAALAAEDSWSKVRELKSGVEMRIYRVNAAAPVRAKFDRASGESLVVITKDGQMAIPREDIQRLECRRGEPRRAVKTHAERKIAPKGAEMTSNTIPGATTSVKTDLEIPSKSRFEKIYERTPRGK